MARGTKAQEHDHRKTPFDGTVFDGTSSAPTDLDSAVFQSIGAAAVCWENIEEAGNFLQDKALGHARDLIVWINEHYIPKE
jgi:hypothetical protein